MISSKSAYDLALALDGVTLRAHFGSDAFYANNRIFATLWHDKMQVNLMFTIEQQRQFLENDGEAFTELPNKWGAKGVTVANLEFIDRDLFAKALRAARETALAKKPGKKAPSRKR